MTSEDQLKIEGDLRKGLLSVVTLIAGWRLGRTGLHPDPTIMSYLTDLLLPIVTPIFWLIDGKFFHKRVEANHLEKKVAQLSPVILTDDQLKETVATVKELRSAAPDAPLGEVVAAANGIKETI